MRMFLIVANAALIIACGSGGGGGSGGGPGPSPSPTPSPTPQPDTSYYPSWYQTAPLATKTISATAGGAGLVSMINSLVPGDRLEVGGGTYTLTSKFILSCRGTAANPIWIVAAAGATPVISFTGASQNVINIAEGITPQVEYLCLRGLEITGGSHGIRIWNGGQIWIDRCHIHNIGEVGLSANTAVNDRLYITDNHIHHTSGTTGEGMYIGGHGGLNGAAPAYVTNSIIARNHVHDCGGGQGDGIELKHKSYGNLIAENRVHDTNYPCILVYGTEGQAVNRVERNICYNSADNVMQVQGEAVVENNLILHPTAGGSAFYSHDHSGTGSSRNLTVRHNTIIHSGTAVRLQHWDSRPGMVFANNAVYSLSPGAVAMIFNAGSAGVTFTGNVLLGTVTGAAMTGNFAGLGASDFVNVTGSNWATADAHLSAASAIIGKGVAVHAVPKDLEGSTRAAPLDPGCYDKP